MKKLKYLLIITVLISTVGITAAFALNRNRSTELEEIITDNFIYTNSELLGVDKLNFDFNFDIKGKSTFEYAGFKYTRSNGFTGYLSNIEIVDSPETVETIGIFEQIGNTTLLTESLYAELDYTKFTNAKNLIIGYEREINYTLRYPLQDLPSIENIYYLNTSLPTLITDTTKNIFLCNGLYTNSNSWSGLNFPDNDIVKYITVDSFKYTYLSYFGKVKNGFPSRDLGKVYVIPNEELPVPINKIPISPSVSYIEYGGAIYSPVKDPYSAIGYIYGLVYIDPLVNKIVINQAFSNYIATMVMVETAYVVGNSLTKSSNLLCNEMIIAFPKVFDSEMYKTKNNVYFYNYEYLVIKEDDIKNITTTFYFPYFSMISFPNGYTYGSYTIGSFLPEVKITAELDSIDTTDLTVKVAELKAVLGIIDIDIYGHPLSKNEELPDDPGDSTLPEEPPLPEDLLPEDPPPVVEPEEPDDEEPINTEPVEPDPDDEPEEPEQDDGENPIEEIPDEEDEEDSPIETPPDIDDESDDTDNSNKKPSNNPKNIMLGTISVVVSLLLFYLIYLVIRRKKEK